MKPQRNVNIVIGEAQLNPNDWGVLEKRINKRPVTYIFADWYLKRYPHKPLRYYYTNDYTCSQQVINASYIKLEKKVKKWAKDNNLL